MSLSLSVLDLVPVRSDQTSADAVSASRSLARVADEQGYLRYWVAEHHNMPAVAATNPPTLIGILAGATSRIRVGSGGVMLPNHAPLVVAEQFALLEAAYPGRIDLGIGRAPGTDPLTRYALRQGSTPAGVDDAVSRFPEYVENVRGLMSGDVAMQLGERVHPLRATPRPRSRPPVWLLGSSDYSARLAGEMGLPYVFAHHFAGRGTAEALALYRASFRPSADHPEPRTLLTANVLVAPTEEEALRRALPQRLAMLTLMTGGPLRDQPLIGEAEGIGIPDEHGPLAAAMLQKWFVGTPDQVGASLRGFADAHEVDEVMVQPVAGADEGGPADASPYREETLRLLAGAING